MYGVCTSWQKKNQEPNQIYYTHALLSSAALSLCRWCLCLCCDAVMLSGFAQGMRIYNAHHIEQRNTFPVGSVPWLSLLLVRLPPPSSTRNRRFVWKRAYVHRTYYNAYIYRDIYCIYTHIHLYSTHKTHMHKLIQIQILIHHLCAVFAMRTTTSFAVSTQTYRKNDGNLVCIIFHYPSTASFFSSSRKHTNVYNVLCFLFVDNNKWITCNLFAGANAQNVHDDL